MKITKARKTSGILYLAFLNIATHNEMKHEKHEQHDQRQSRNANGTVLDVVNVRHSSLLSTFSIFSDRNLFYDSQQNLSCPALSVISG
jgi:hypothetical protein